MTGAHRGRLWTWNFLVVVGMLLLAPVAAITVVLRPHYRRGMGSRLGAGWPAPTKGERLWAHAASVGEVEGIVPLVRRWSEENPGAPVLITAQTRTGIATAARLVPEADTRLAPLDLPFLTRRLVARMRPSLFLFTENELWPNLLAEMARAGVPAVQVSGRLSRRAAALLARVPGFSATLLSSVSRFLLQSDADRERLADLGVDDARLFVTGSLKAAGDRREPPAALASLARRELVVAGSTHAGEEEILVAAMEALASTHPALLWLLAPRHPERFAEVAALLESAGIPFVRRTELAGARLGEGTRVVLLDTVGELAGCYGLARVAFVGGSLVPVGGHNLLEPARFGVPIVVGPHVESVAELAGRLENEGVLRRAADPAVLAAEVEHFLHLEGASRGALTERARAVAAELSTVLDDTWRALSHPPLGEGVS